MAAVDTSSYAGESVQLVDATKEYNDALRVETDASKDEELAEVQAAQDEGAHDVHASKDSDASEAVGILDGDSELQLNGKEDATHATEEKADNTPDSTVEIPVADVQESVPELLATAEMKETVHEDTVETDALSAMTPSAAKDESGLSFVSKETEVVLPNAQEVTTEVPVDQPAPQHPVAAASEPEIQEPEAAEEPAVAAPEATVEPEPESVKLETTPAPRAAEHDVVPEPAEPEIDTQPAAEEPEPKVEEPATAVEPATKEQEVIAEPEEAAEAVVAKPEVAAEPEAEPEPASEESVKQAEPIIAEPEVAVEPEEIAKPVTLAEPAAVEHVVSEPDVGEQEPVSESAIDAEAETEHGAVESGADVEPPVVEPAAGPEAVEGSAVADPGVETGPAQAAESAVAGPGEPVELLVAEPEATVAVAVPSAEAGEADPAIAEPVIASEPDAVAEVVEAPAIAEAEVVEEPSVVEPEVVEEPATTVAGLQTQASLEHPVDPVEQEQDAAPLLTEEIAVTEEAEVSTDFAEPVVEEPSVEETSEAPVLVASSEEQATSARGTEIAAETGPAAGATDEPTGNVPADEPIVQELPDEPTPAADVSVESETAVEILPDVETHITPAETSETSVVAALEDEFIPATTLASSVVHDAVPISVGAPAPNTSQDVDVLGDAILVSGHENAVADEDSIAAEVVPVVLSSQILGIEQTALASAQEMLDQSAEVVPEASDAQLQRGTPSPSLLSAHQPEVERPKSPWTPSYSVTQQGPGTLEASVEDQEEIEQLEQLPPAVAALKNSEATNSTTSVTAVVDETESLASDVSLSVSTTSLDIPDPEERPKSPWTPSYSVTTQGSAARGDIDVDDAELEQLPPPATGVVEAAPEAQGTSVASERPTLVDVPSSVDSELLASASAVDTPPIDAFDAVLDTSTSATSLEEEPEPATAAEATESSQGAIPVLLEDAPAVEAVQAELVVANERDQISPEEPIAIDQSVAVPPPAEVSEPVEAVSSQLDGLVKANESDISEQVQGAPGPAQEESIPGENPDVSSGLSVQVDKDAPTERPKSPWTPSYSVTTLNSGVDPEDATLVPGQDANDELIENESKDISSTVETDVPTHVPSVEELPSTEAADKSTTSLAIPDNDPHSRPESPWTPSYSVHKQGPGVTEEDRRKDQEEVDALEPLPDLDHERIGGVTNSVAVKALDEMLVTEIEAGDAAEGPALEDKPLDAVETDTSKTPDDSTAHEHELSDADKALDEALAADVGASDAPVDAALMDITSNAASTISRPESFLSYFLPGSWLWSAPAPAPAAKDEVQAPEAAQESTDASSEAPVPTHDEEKEKKGRWCVIM